MNDRLDNNYHGFIDNHTATPTETNRYTYGNGYGCGDYEPNGYPYGDDYTNTPTNTTNPPPFLNVNNPNEPPPRQHR